MGEHFISFSCIFSLNSMLWGKIAKNQVFFFLKNCFFQNFNWSNLIFDQLKSCFKNSVSLCLVWLIEPVFRSIEHRVSGFLKTVLWLIQTPFQKFFSNFSSLSDLARQHKDFFVVFYLNFCKFFLPQGRYDYSIPPFLFYFHDFMHFFMHLKGIFGPP